MVYDIRVHNLIATGEVRKDYTRLKQHMHQRCDIEIIGATTDESSYESIPAILMSRKEVRESNKHPPQKADLTPHSLEF
jgi:hypothetical protein